MPSVATCLICCLLAFKEACVTGTWLAVDGFVAPYRLCKVDEKGKPSRIGDFILHISND